MVVRSMINPLDFAILICLTFGTGCCLYAIYLTLKILDSYPS